VELLSFGNPALVQPEVQAVSERLNRALKVARMVAREWDLKTGRILYSANAPDVLGVCSDQAEMSWAAVHSDDAPTLRGIVDRAIAGEWEYVTKVRFIRPDNGALRWLELRGSVVHDSGVPERISGVSGLEA